MIDIYDYGDKYDAEKWDFDESGLPVYIINNYVYKATSEENALKMVRIRNQINKLCENIEKNKHTWKNITKNKEYLNGIDIFLGIHKEKIYDPLTLPSPFYYTALKGIPTSRYLISEMPKGTKFDGLDKPKMRYLDKYAPPVGKDGKIRCLYRDIFLNLNLSESKLKKLIIHELAHTMANHVRYRPDDHHHDFDWCEKFIAKYW